MARLERRQFGRRQTQIQGWVRVPGRARVPCLIKNLSVLGAFLEMESTDWLPFRFGLQVGSSRIEQTCEIKHTAANGVGVVFLEGVSQEIPVKRRAPLSEADQWSGVSAPTLSRRK